MGSKCRASILIRKRHREMTHTCRGEGSGIIQAEGGTMGPETRRG